VYLLLVAVGIVILLGGVWVVSIQTEGGGVDVGVWDRSESESEGEGVVGGESENEECTWEENGQQQRRQHRRAQREARSDISSSDVRCTPSTTRRVTSPVLGRLGPPESPPPSSSLHPLTTSTFRLNRRGTFDMYSYPSQSLTQLSPIGTGFQIGLSPVSPGFVLVPAERRRRAGSIFGGEERRRTVSEGVER